MKEELTLFSKTLDPDHFKNAAAIRNELVDQNHPQPELVINTKQLYEKAFEFPKVATYDDVQNLLTEVQNSQDNLNQNQDNEVLMQKFVQTATKIKENFKKSYGEQWNDPGAGQE